MGGLLVMPFLVFVFVAGRAGVLLAACSAVTTLSGEIALLLATAKYLERRENKQPENQSSPVRNRLVRKPGGSRLSYEPLVTGFGEITVEVSVAIEKMDIDLREKLQACRALTEASCFGADVYRIPPTLLRNLSPNPVENLKLRASVRHGMFIECAHGTCRQIRREFGLFLNSPCGSAEAVQERGEFVDGRFFTEDVFMHVTRDYLSGDVEIKVISRPKLTSTILRELDRLEKHLRYTAS